MGINKEKQNLSRRSFLKASGIATAAAAASVLPKKAHASRQAWEDGMQINPNIDNLRVVCCHDTDMISGEYNNPFSDQNDAVDTAVVEANMDAMAISLAQTNTASEAWAAIFRKPSGKEWTAVKCAIKVNCINTDNMPRIAIVNKVCEELIALGVSAANIIIYDGCHNASGNSKYTPYIGDGLPASVKVSSRSGDLNDETDVSVTDFGDSVPCTADIANGVVDILVNVAVNKGHSSNAAGMTLCMKNHFGTFKPVCSLSGYGSSYRFPYIIAINKHDAIVGGTPARQQLCIMDALWSATSGPGGEPSHTTDRIVMGTFGPAVDYLVTKKIREDIMDVTPDSKVADILTEFGYTTSQRDALDLVDVAPASGIRKPPRGNAAILHRSQREYPVGTYDVSGRRIPDSRQGNTHGVIIRKGKKIFQRP